METDMIDRLFLELSQVTKAVTKKESDQLKRIVELEKIVKECCVDKCDCDYKQRDCPIECCEFDTQCSNVRSANGG